MNSEPLVSIIIPVYNVKHYLNKCMTSVVYQTYKNLEIILVDDGSTDGSSKLCDGWAKKDSRVKVIHKLNGGLSDARNCGIKSAKGKYLYFLDSDDWVSIDLIEKMMNLIKRYNTDMIIFQFAYVYPDGRTVRNYNSGENLKILDKKNTLLLLMQDLEVTNHVWRKFYKKELVSKEVFPIGKNFEDMYAMPRLINGCKNIAVINDCLYFYRVNEDGIVRTLSLKNFEDRFEGIISEYEEIKKIEPSISDLAESSKIEKILGLTMEIYKSNLPDSEINILLKNIRKVLSKTKFLNVHNHKNKLKWLLVRYFPSSLNYINKYKINEFKSEKRKKRVNNQRRIKEKIRMLDSTKPKFIVLATPTYGNLGDQALKFGEFSFIKKYFPNYQILSIPLNILDDVKDVLNDFISENDIVSLQAGGNIGTLYPGIHNVQQDAIKYFKDHKIVIFPQTFYYENNNVGKLELKKTYNIYKMCKDLIVFVRDETSYELIKNNMKGIRVYMMPDMALMLPITDGNLRGDGALLILRNDSEKTLSDEQDHKILSTVESKFSQVKQRDTHTYREQLSSTEAKNALNQLFQDYMSAKIVITDRLHGMLFAFLTNTPCIVLKSKSPKIKGVYFWIKDAENIMLIDDVNQLSKSIDLLLKSSKFENSKKAIANKFSVMSDLIKGH
jgi:exopolysaccharide biosynthesis predicted pyruvyltransferase EpsI